MNSNDMSKWLTLAGLITTANAMWIPDKRAINFQNEDTGTFDKDSTTSKEKTTTRTEKKTTTHSEKKTTKEKNASTTHSSAKSTEPASVTTTSANSDSTPSSTSAPTSTTVASTTSAPTSSISSNSSSGISATPTISSVNSITASLTSSSAISSSSTTASAAASSSSSSSSTGAIAGGIVAVVAVAGIGAAALLFVRRKRRRELKRSRAARMSTRADPYSGGYGSDPKDYTEHQNNNVASQPVHNETIPQVVPAAYGAYEPALAAPDNHSKEMIEQQQQQYYQSQQSLAAVQPTDPIVPPIVVAPVQEQTQTPSLGTFTVIATYIPTLSDELEIEPGDRIELLVEYDDGWCQGINITRNYAKGVFPRHCIDYATIPSDNTTSDVERTKRVSSMYMTGPN
ncbi:hypothetical protein G6F57_006939 [Rhizopus arrhizus]|uniref:SH3 domain-containing protein n=1 Tax=Rhizopus oryzae TaxID=64495 RepID=A0A9P6X8K0_RHIOR|nr:hypothetical protein G6F23_008196 [Rhizopus arrhizus]KAG1421457.1 hypothetical protein G6F58_003735 [Rhizopus delemar]KAG0762644.1 hypothetical protein G6F24_006642 [Rhizopus arrhizus]KAG0778043.1 hypothetical protein G6F22_011469 [Rhizopus arrhizus]KAG0795034.1 hypothetical protein G6F21_002419 [Rhizopus arrhizus]